MQEKHHHRSKHRVVLANGGHRCRCRPGERGGRGRREAGLRLAPAPPPPPRRGAPAARPPWRWRPARPAASPVPAASTSPPAAALLHPHLRLGHNVAAKDAEALLPTHSSLLSAAARLVPHRLEPRACSCARGDDEHRGGLHRRRGPRRRPPPPSPGCIGEEDHGLLVKSATAAGGEGQRGRGRRWGDRTPATDSSAPRRRPWMEQLLDDLLLVADLHGCFRESPPPWPPPPPPPPNHPKSTQVAAAGGSVEGGDHAGRRGKEARRRVRPSGRRRSSASRTRGEEARAFRESGGNGVVLDVSMPFRGGPPAVGLVS
uniref:Uncharacterized protein n=1 Tax=Oryza sativa subsp. japonica TaxID=39947 RepID=Q6ASR7_ORYSJ|nr:hypothetical protein [Oryza sativa Japonica Group]AAT94005.1 hypothetical protein [Oryza sativa Japonica Group]